MKTEAVLQRSWEALSGLEEVVMMPKTELV